MIRVLLADDHPLIREGLRKILELEADVEVIAEAADAEDTIAKVGEHVPDVVVMDVNMPKGGGLAATRAVRTGYPSVQVIVLTIHDDDEYVGELLRAGARGYLLKDADPANIVDAIRQVHQGEGYLAQGLMGKAISQLQSTQFEPRPQIENLTEREREILALIVAGRTNREIGGHLFITEKTVKNHITSLLRKLNLQDRTQAAVFAVRHRLVSNK